MRPFIVAPFLLCPVVVVFRPFLILVVAGVVGVTFVVVVCVFVFVVVIVGSVYTFSFSFARAVDGVVRRSTAV